MKTLRQLQWTFAVLVSLFLTSGLAAQDTSGNPNPANDPPARVARIQYISGQVSMQPGGANDWVAASLNRPLTTSDRVWADKDSRVELNVGTAFIRMNSETSVTLTNVGDNAMQVELDQGTLELTVRHLEPGEIFEIDTPNLAFNVMKSGVYRIDVPPNSAETWVTVRKGQGQATGQNPAVKVSEGEQVRFSGQGTLQNAAYSAPSPDGFDDWAKVRDKRLDGTQSARYVAPGVIGYEDLDYYGTWQTVPTYGAIWVPAGVPAGWAPYRYGRWAWIAPWGWTWVDSAPWGFAPFHYGRWVSYGGAWAWAPGPAYVGWRPYYAPALVGWVGGGGFGFGVSFGFGFGAGCGWFPLGWGEPFYPWYHGYRGGYVSQAYVRNVNVTNTRIVNINNVTNNYYKNSFNNVHYANRNVNGAVTAAPRTALANGELIQRVGRALPRNEVAQAQVVHNVDVAPTKQAVLGGSPARTTGIPPRMGGARPIVPRTDVAASPATRTGDPRITGNAPSSAATVNPAANNVKQPATIASRPPEGRPAANATAADVARNPANVTQAPNTVRPPERTAPTSQAAVNSPAQVGPQHAVPRPPYAGGTAPRVSAPGERAGTYTYQGGHPPVAPQPTTRVAPAASPASTVRANPPSAVPAAPPANHSGQAHEPKKANPAATVKANPGMASSNAPHPPAAYTYQASPAYSGSGYAGSSYSARSTRSYSPSTTPYAGAQSSYSAPSPSYRSGSYSSPAPAYSGRVSSQPTVHYAAPPSYSGGGGHYSAPSYSGGNGGHGNSSGARGADHNR